MKSDISDNVVLIDWVTLSCKFEDPAVLMNLVGLQGVEWEPMSHGLNGYKQGFFCHNIKVLYDGNEGMGTCLDMSGQGCRTFEEFGTADFEGLFALAIEYSEQYNLARLDVAFDDHTGIIDIDRLFHDCDNGEFVSKFRKAKIEKEFSDGDPGITVYHGSKHSAILLRIYDKAAERKFDDGRHWVRVEMQLRDDRALAFVSAEEPIGERFCGVLLNYVRYVEPGTDSNRWRWPMKDYWSDLVGEVARIQLYVKPGIEYNIGQLDRYVFQQAGNAIYAALEIYGVSGFCKGVRNRGTSLSPKYERLISQFGRNTKGSAAAGQLNQECNTGGNEHENKPEVHTAIRPGDELHRSLPWRQFQPEVGELRS